jgi:DNA invertase Pin-like site-specific DNA recombinase
MRQYGIVFARPTIFEVWRILRDRVKAGIAQARKQGKPHGRPPTVKECSAEIKSLFARGLSKREIAKRLKIGRTSVRRILAQKNPGP